jgi:signal transduction histidine kinase
LGLLGAVALISSLHYYTPVGMHLFHFPAVYQRLYYLPILFACYRFGLGWGLFYALVSGLGYAPHIFYQWPSDTFESFTQYLEIGLFFCIAGLTGWLFDLDRRQRAALLSQQHELRRSERLALMGQMAAGLAHEIRNPLQALTGSAEILRGQLTLDLQPQHPGHEFLELLQRELAHSNRILDDFLAFAKPRKPERLQQEIHEVIEGALEVARPALHRCGVKVDTDIEKDLPLILLDSGQIQQLLLNLIFNARDAQPDGGRVRIEAKRIKKSGLALMELRVRDAGPGISAQESESLFAPFHTRKEKGTGLGLAISRRIAESHGGTLDWEPVSKGKQKDAVSFPGATFVLRLPLDLESGEGAV